MTPRDGSSREADAVRAPAAPALEAKAAMAGFLKDFSVFQTEIRTKMKTQDERFAALDRKSAASLRPPLSRAAESDAPHRKAVAAYVRGGDESALRALSVEAKGLTTAVAGDGGYLVDPQTADRIATVMRGAGSLRDVAKVATVEAGVYDVLVDHGDLEAGWAAETGDAGETATPVIDRISIPLHELAAMPKASQRLLDDAAFDVETWLAERIADRFGREESSAFVAGDGIEKPTGFLTYSAVQEDSWAWGSLGYVATGADGDFNAGEPADALVDLIYALGAKYRGRATFVMNSKTAGVVRKIKDADGRFLWAEGLGSEQPARLMGYPVVIVEDMPDIASGETAIAFGDFSSGYTIAERPDVRVMRDPFSAKPHVLFYATKRVGGDVTDFAAIKLLKFAQA